MQRWSLPDVEASGRRSPRVLLSESSCRAVVIDLHDGEELGDHQVRERALLQVISGSVEVRAAGESVQCGAGTLVAFEPGERHAVAARGSARLLLVLTPWPADGHYAPGEDAQPERMPSRATAEPIGD
jgi:quercetin dioxygenase-like cupin family protein